MEAGLEGVVIDSSMDRARDSLLALRNVHDVSE